jgi:hypothetical protein
VASIREKMKMAAKMAASGDVESAWTTVKNARGGNKCKGCYKRWDKMSAGELRNHALCDDQDGCPHTKDK